MASLSNFIRMSDALIEFNAQLDGETLAHSSTHSLEVHKEELKEIWQRIKPSYEATVKELLDTSTKDTTDDLGTARARYQTIYRTYVDTVAKISETIETKRTIQATSATNSTSNHDDSHARAHIHLPPCDIEPFLGDYLSWPTFRDLFTAIYINNNRISAVERLFHLNNKTRGEAKQIVQKAPLTNEGFDVAWNSLQIRYDNRRLLINSQFKVMFNLETITKESGDSIKSIQGKINSVISSLKLYKVDIQSWDPIFVYLCSRRLPEITLSLWEQTVTNKMEYPSWDELNNFLTSRYQTLETVSDLCEHHPSSNTSDCPKPLQKIISKPSYSKRINSYQNSLAPPACKLCSNQAHTIRLCPKFVNMCYTERLAYIKKLGLCLNCFSKGHAMKDCKSPFNCFECGRRHNTLLHFNEEPSVPIMDSNPDTYQLLSTTPNESVESSNSIQSCVATSSKRVLLGTAIINIVHYGETFTARALFDSGSEASFISEHLFKLLKLKSHPILTKISGLNGVISANSQKVCNLKISSPINTDVSIEATTIVIPKLTSLLPTFTVNPAVFSNLPPLQLADSDFFNTSHVDILIGADLLPQVMLNGVKNGICSTLMAQETVFGWILTGPIPSESITSCRTVVSYLNEMEIDKQISKFWEVEDIPQKKHMSEPEIICETIYENTTTRSPSGRYIVNLPFKSEFPVNIQLGHSKNIAKSQFIRNENRLLKNPELKQQYDDVLNEYLLLGHMKETSGSSSNDTNLYYLPHHAVIRPDSVTTKVRVVFNGSCPTSNGNSLNDVLYPGPSLQLDLTLLILQWRFFKIVFNSDIEKLYRQILIAPDCTPFQRICYRDSPQKELKEYELQTVTFGLNCAPYLALRTIQQLARDVKEVYPIASNILSANMYVDDILAGSHDIESALEAKTQVIAALSSAGFSLRKWTSNSQKFLDSVPKEDLLHEDFLRFEDKSVAKTLGVQWNARIDKFNFTAKEIKSPPTPTKRQVLSEISKLFDPAGWLCPYIVLAKLLMRDIWSTKIGWDDTLPNNLLHSWNNFLQNYININQIQIPRWVGFSPGDEIQIHGFCDASEKAYAATIYVRISTERGGIISHILTAKSKVAPLKTISIPRLELCGALLLAETIDSILPCLPIPNCKIFCWTDSTIVLAWLKKPPFNWKTFIANRVSKIFEIVDVENWFHIDSKQNPADIASRGAFPKDLSQHELWWSGPSWLRLSPSLWPIQLNLHVDDNLLEPRIVQSNFAYFQDYHDHLDRFSSLGRALRVLSYVLRIITNTRASQNPNARFNNLSLQSSEIVTVRNRLIVLAQKFCFPNEYKNLKDKKIIPTSSSISTLNPFLDPQGLMRMCSRIANSESLTYDERYPIILPYNCIFTKLLIKFIHTITIHGGNSLMLRVVRLQFWIPRVKNLIKFTINQCKICVISKHKLQTQLMGTLPPERTTFSRAFTNTGLDFAGPFEIKNLTARSCTTSKGYVCIFICFSTRAIHLELTSSLSTPSFLAAFQRFVSRRGCPRNLYSDNGKTFVGASKEIASQFLQSSKETTTSHFSHQNLSWYFIPPGAPHMGGLWEAGVKSFKTHFRKIASSYKFTFEEFTTILSRIEACLNSRPLSPLSENPEDLLALTPGHFLVGGPLLAPAETLESESNISSLNRWRRVKALTQQFIIRWKNEYLKELHKRFKWKRPQPNIEHGSMFVVREESTPPTEWRLGRISKIYHGRDNLVRIVDIQTQKGTITRPLVKVVLLPKC